MKFAYWPGCSVPRQGTPELRITAAAVCDKLGIELEDLSLAPCTGSGILQARDLVYADTLNASTFAMAEDMGLPLMTICSTCQGVFSQARKRLKEKPDYLAQINQTLEEQGMKYSGNLDVKHLLWVLVEDYGLDEVKKAVVKPLAGLRVAPFYGCYLLRPSAALGFEEHPERITCLESLIEALKECFDLVTTRPVAVVCAIGSNIAKPGVLAQAAGALAKSNINILAVTQTSRQTNMQFVVERDSFKDAQVAGDQGIQDKGRSPIHHLACQQRCEITYQPAHAVDGHSKCSKWSLTRSQCLCRARSHTYGARHDTTWVSA